MNKPLSEQEIATLQVPGPVKTETMTRREKLLRWASVLDHSPQHFNMYRDLEYMQPDQRDALPIAGTAFEAAVHDPVLADAGLQGTTTVGGVCTFMELTPSQMHAFACGCGGQLTNHDAAERIAFLANNPGYRL